MKHRGLPVRDADDGDPDLLKVVLAVDDVTEGVERLPWKCMVARGLERGAVPGVLGGDVGAKVAYVIFERNPSEWVRYVLSTRARKVVRAYDEHATASREAARWIAGKSVEIRRPPPSMQLGARPEARGSNTREGKASNIRSRRDQLRHIGMANLL